MAVQFPCVVFVDVRVEVGGLFDGKGEKKFRCSKKKRQRSFRKHHLSGFDLALLPIKLRDFLRTGARATYGAVRQLVFAL